MKCIIIEDQPPAQRILKKYIQDYGSLDLVNCFSDALAALDYLAINEVDLIFLDIHLPKISGLEFLKTLTQRPAVILTTAFPDFALESYDLDVTDYLLKPFSFQRFVKAVNKAKSGHSTNIPSPKESEFIFVKSGHDHIKVILDDIIFIKSDRDYTEIYVANGKYLSSESLKYWSESLPSDQFLRVHKSYVINSSKTEIISAKSVKLIGDHEVPIGRAFKKELSALYGKS